MDVSNELQAALNERRELWRRVDEIGKRIEDLSREEEREIFVRLKSVTNNALAASVGVSPATVGHWRAGRFKINGSDLKTLRMLAGMPEVL